ncbi:MAG: STAS domain-containing protein [Phycisphaerae bacterium]
MPESLIVEIEDEVTAMRFKDPSMLDALAIQRIGKELSELIETATTKKVVVNFDGIRFLSSEALRVLIGLRSKADKAGRKVALCGIRPDLMRVFQLTNLDKLFTIFDNVDTAKAKL